MSFYNWIQEKLFDNYEEWRLKSPDYNRNGFNIVGIDNTLQAMHDGFFMYIELYPPCAIDGCTAMKARVGKTPDAVDIFLDINDKTYRMADVSYPDAVQMMRAFVKKRRLPDRSLFVETVKIDVKQIKSTFAELAALLLGDTKQAKSFMSKVKLTSMDDIEDDWWNLYEKLQSKGRAVEISLKIELEDFLYHVQKLIRNKSLDTSENLTIDTAAFDDSQCIGDWCAHFNSTWKNHKLVGMDIGTDSLVLMVLSNEEFKRAQELAKELLHRIDVAERL
ncbi:MULTISPECIES: DUF6630 family protein [Veillonella]|uniref:DUF6630 domain-containing protein n=2 Tax=Veillonella TaxID=29465 RepID=A0A133S4F8_9FIRM|nr:MULTISPECIES: DUF6630 family protein [Veillonella]KXA63942.1 hypothetical protein HMPREF3233_01195 [Veillonella atypica]MBS5709751.1 hypothetical protein [Veillonella sp.]MDU4397838.1 DUF6630 family protein [Veillonella sp.]MDU5083649.1 DUF6630 family protein [Veillonella sp.]MDU6397992.1 DUF6630 family protein [Veillonella sp.]